MLKIGLCVYVLYLAIMSANKFLYCNRGDATLKDRAIKQFIDTPYEYGLDKEHGGLYYFLDSEGYCPTQLEWSMKLWWVHCEAMIAFLMAYQESGNEQYWRTFLGITEYTLTKVGSTVCIAWRHVPCRCSACVCMCVAWHVCVCACLCI